MEHSKSFRGSSLKDANGKILKKRTNNVKKSYKCNQCKFASSQASHLRTHLKKHSGEKPNKCNQCDYASSSASHLSRHLKTHSGENKIKTEIKEEYGEPLSSDTVKKEPLEMKTEDVKEEYVEEEIEEEIVDSAVDSLTQNKIKRDIKGEYGAPVKKEPLEKKTEDVKKEYFEFDEEIKEEIVDSVDNTDHEKSCAEK